MVQSLAKSLTFFVDLLTSLNYTRPMKNSNNWKNNGDSSVFYINKVISDQLTVPLILNHCFIIPNIILFNIKY